MRRGALEEDPHRISEVESLELDLSILSDVSAFKQTFLVDGVIERRLFELNTVAELNAARLSDA